MQGVYCPRCKIDSFTQARLIEPLDGIDQELKSVSSLTQKPKKSLQDYKMSQIRSKKASVTLEFSPSLSSPSSSLPLRNLQNISPRHSSNGSGEKSSLTSSKGRKSLFKFGSSMPKAHISYAMFVDARFLLAYTSHTISRCDCEFRTWAECHSFGKIIMAAGSSIRYAIISKETTVSFSLSSELRKQSFNTFVQEHKLTVFRCDQISEFEEGSQTLQAQPHSLAISRQGHRIAVGFESATQIFDGGLKGSELLPAAGPDDQASFQVDSQCMSFSICGNHLVVATRETREGVVYVGVHDLLPLQPYNQQMRNLRIPTVGSQDYFVSITYFSRFLDH